MEIVVGFGTREIKELIKQELEIMTGFLPDDFFQKTQLQRIVVPLDFQAEIHKLTNDYTYKSIRDFGNNSINVLGKIVAIEDGFAIVLSPLLYVDTENQDFQTRMSTVFHELHHAINRRDFPKVLKVEYVWGLYYDKLYSLYDEYSCDCFAHKMVEKHFSLKSEIWEKHISLSVNGFVKAINDTGCYDFIKQEIESFKVHGNVGLFIENTQNYTQEMMTVLVHTYFLAHYFPDEISHDILLKSPFVNNKTFALMEYLKEKENMNEKKLDDGLDLMIDFLENFGIRYEYIDSGNYYCRVLDI